MTTARAWTEVRSRLRLDLACAVLVSALAAGSVLQHYRSVARLAEEAAVDATVRLLRESLRLHAAVLVMQGRREELRQLQRGNPFALIAAVPPNYAGTVDGAPAARSPGTWRFDVRSRTLIYDWAQVSRPSSRFRIEATFKDLDGDGRYTAGSDMTQGLDLESLTR